MNYLLKDKLKNILSFGENSFNEDNQCSPANPLLESNRLLKIKENLDLNHDIKNNSFIKNNFYNNFEINKEVLDKYKKNKTNKISVDLFNSERCSPNDSQDFIRSMKKPVGVNYNISSENLKNLKFSKSQRNHFSNSYGYSSPNKFKFMIDSNSTSNVFKREKSSKYRQIVQNANKIHNPNYYLQWVKSAEKPTNRKKFISNLDKTKSVFDLFKQQNEECSFYKRKVKKQEIDDSVFTFNKVERRAPRIGKIKLTKESIIPTEQLREMKNALIMLTNEEKLQVKRDYIRKLKDLADTIYKTFS